MKIRSNLKQKILSLIEKEGYVIIKTSEEAISHINKLFPNTSNETINYLDRRKNNYIVFRRTLESFSIGYRFAEFSYYTPDGVQYIRIKESDSVDIKELL